MKPSMKHTLAIALLAGSTLSVVPAIAQSQAPAVSQDGGNSAVPILPRKGAPGSDGSSGAKQAQPQQDMGATTQQPQGSAGGNDKMNAQAQSGDQQRLKPKGDRAPQEKSGETTKTQASDAQSPATDNTAQQKPAGQSDSSTTANSGSGSGTDAGKPATDDTARQNNGAQQPGSDQAATDKPSNETTGSINISTEQRTEVRNILVQNKVEPVDVDISVDVGVAVPTTVELHPLPSRIVEIVPAYRGYEYFVLADGRIIIVDPSSHEVVYILVG
ncbi:Bll4293 protein [Neorhizobium galegae bv. orientalis]|nr:Bll4293 protein [Neorhizobium galegae bv. orientalis]